MNVGVCIKPSIDSSAFKPRESANEGDYPLIIPKPDMVAISKALELKESGMLDQISLYTVGPQRYEYILKPVLGLGVDFCYRIGDDENKFRDCLNIANILLKVLKDESLNLIFFGDHGVNTNNKQICSRIAQELNIPEITSVIEFNLSKRGKINASRKLEGGRIEKIIAKVPAAIGFTRGYSRYISVYRKLKANKYTINELDLSSFSDVDRFGGIEIKKIGPPKPKKIRSLSHLSTKERLKLMRQGTSKEGEKVSGDPDSLTSEFIKFVRGRDII